MRFGAYGGHHIGTARMGSDVRTSVVDSDCRVHSVDNLFVAGSAVFPTSGQANPTLTLIACRCGWATICRERFGHRRLRHLNEIAHENSGSGWLGHVGSRLCTMLRTAVGQRR